MNEHRLRHMVLPPLRLHHVRGERKALMAARPFVPEAGMIDKQQY